MEGLISDCGGFGKFQILLISGVASHKMAAGWSMLQMSYAGFIPDWHCSMGTHENSTAEHYSYNNETFRQCSITNNDTENRDMGCPAYQFQGPSKTVVTEWYLVCDKKWIKSVITSIQMAGVLVGALMSGQLANLFGRKKIAYGFSLFHSLLNFGAAFAASWEMFAIFRFLLGMGIGGILVVAFLYPIEFLPIKWRPIMSIIPFWPVGVGVFAVAALLLDNWAHLHIALGVFSLPVLLSYFYVPESVRWLTLKGRFDEAEKVFERMAAVNGKLPPKHTRDVLEKIYKDEQESRFKGREYTYLDLFKGKKQVLVSLTFCYVWFMLSCVYYGFSFGVSALSGSLYLNIFLLSIVSVPVNVSTFYFNNKFMLSCVYYGFSFGVSALSGSLYLNIFLLSIVSVPVNVSTFYFNNKFMLSCVYYGFSFGVSALSGSLYLNIFLFSIVSLPVKISSFYFINKIGRKWTAIAMLVTGAVSSCGCLIVYYVMSADNRGGWITGLSIFSKTGIAAAWSAIATWVSEFYPTVTRTLGYGMVNTVARLGGMAAPFLIDLDYAPFRTYAIITAMIVLAIVLLFFVSDTKGKLLLDSIKVKNKTCAIELEKVGNKTDRIKNERSTVEPKSETDTSGEKCKMSCGEMESTAEPKSAGTRDVCKVSYISMDPSSYNLTPGSNVKDVLGGSMNHIAVYRL